MAEFRAEAKKMVVALVDMKRAFSSPQHFNSLVHCKMDRLQREDDGNGRQVRKWSYDAPSLLARERM